MILDTIIGLFLSLFVFFAEKIVMVIVPFVNLITAGIEAVIGIFISGFSLGRIERKKGESKPAASAVGGIATSLIIIGLFGWFVLAPKVMNRELTLVADDGQSLPFAALIIHTKGGEQHERTDSAGTILIPRFRTTSVTVKDPRYIEKTWEKSEIESELIVRRTLLGSGLDSLADQLLKPMNK
jgi:hypothetical protein